MKEMFLTGLRGLRHRGVQVLCILAVYTLIAPYLPVLAHRGLYTISLFIKDILVWLLPVTVGMFIAQAICSFQRKAPLFVAAIIVFEGLSNMCSVWYAYGCGQLASGYLPPLQIPPTGADFLPLWHVPFSRPSWWSSDKGCLAGLLLGMLAVMFHTSFLPRLVEKGKQTAQYILTHFFSPLIPIFVLGFVARMYQTHMLHDVITHSSLLLLWLVGALAVYISFLFFLSSDFTVRGTLTNLKNLLPAGGIAFSSGCSLSTMPWTIAGASKNLKDPQLAQAIIPATTNIQQVGDCLTQAFLCFLLYKHFFGHAPDLITWCNFSMVFVLARFATAAILGGAIFVMLPIYESCLSFNAEMIAVILAFNVILDPIITSCNVIANGALCRVFEKVWTAVLTQWTKWTTAKHPSV
jgi:hypothetical protein